MCKLTNARAIQGSIGPAAFFQEFGFVLLNMPTKVKNWNTDHSKTNTEVSTIYKKEVETAIRQELYPEPKFGVLENMHLMDAVLSRG